MDEKQQVLMELVKERFGSEEFQKQVVEVMRDQMVVTGKKIVGEEGWTHTFTFPTAEQAKKEDLTAEEVNWKVRYVAEKFPASTAEDREKLLRVAEDVAALNMGSFTGIVDSLLAAVQADLTKSIVEGEQPQVIEVTARDPEPMPLPERLKHRCDEQQAKPRKVTNREKRRDRHAKRAARRR